MYPSSTQLLIFFVTFFGADSVFVSEECIHCICEACSGCDTSIRCEGTACGPFYITRPFWEGAGSLTVNSQNSSDADAYQNCSNDLQCAALTVHNYMKKYETDCNIDGVIDCDDFVAIHKLGGGRHCRGALPESYYNRYLQCKQFARVL